MYAIQSGNSNSDGSNTGLFAIGSSGFVSLASGFYLDASVQTQYTLVITASVSGNSAIFASTNVSLRVLGAYPSVVFTASNAGLLNGSAVMSSLSTSAQGV